MYVVCEKIQNSEIRVRKTCFRARTKKILSNFRGSLYGVTWRARLLEIRSMDELKLLQVSPEPVKRLCVCAKIQGNKMRQLAVCTWFMSHEIAQNEVRVRTGDS